MNEPRIEFAERDAFVEARYLGSYTLDTYKEQMRASVEGCLERKRTRLLVDITALEGYRPTAGERHAIGVYGAALSRPLDKVAALGTKDQIEPDPLATMVARNRGLQLQAFTDRTEAIAWLLKD